MRYELLNIIEPNTDIWQRSKARLVADGGVAIMLAPNAGMPLLQELQGINMLGIVDSITGQVDYQTTKNGYFFNAVPTIEMAEIFMNTNGSITILSNGQNIGEIKTYGGTRRIVKEVIYRNSDGTTDFIEEYTSDGHLYSNLFYTRNEIQEINFYDKNKFAVLCFFFYQGVLNYIRVYDGQNHNCIKEYQDMNAYYRENVAHLVTAADQVAINYMGIELNALQATKSDNTLYLNESPLDESGHVKGNLFQILNDDIKYVQHVVMTQAMFDELPQDISTDKVTIQG